MTDKLNWKRIFTHNELYFPSPSKFNDPFDCRVDFDIDLKCSKSDVKKYLEKAQRNMSTPIDIKRILNDEEELRRNIKRLAREELQPELEKQMGILSLSEKNYDILMWSHYADGHRGFCLEFDGAALHNWKYCQPVNYDENFLPFGEFCDALPELNDNNQKKSMRAFVLRKSSHWKYESEWRVIVNVTDERGRTLIYPQEILTGVIFGCRMSNDNKIIIKNTLDGRKIKLYEAIEKQNKFELEVKEV